MTYYIKIYNKYKCGNSSELRQKSWSNLCPRPSSEALFIISHLILIFRAWAQHSTFVLSEFQPTDLLPFPSPIWIQALLSVLFQHLPADKAALSLLSDKSLINGHQQKEQLWPHLSWGLHFLLLRHWNYSTLCSSFAPMALICNPEDRDFYSQDISHLHLPCPSLAGQEISLIWCDLLLRNPCWLFPCNFIIF